MIKMPESRIILEISPCPITFALYTRYLHIANYFWFFNLNGCDTLERTESAAGYELQGLHEVSWSRCYYSALLERLYAQRTRSVTTGRVGG